VDAVEFSPTQSDHGPAVLGVRGPASLKCGERFGLHEHSNGCWTLPAFPLVPGARRHSGVMAVLDSSYSYTVKRYSYSTRTPLVPGAELRTQETHPSACNNQLKATYENRYRKYRHLQRAADQRYGRACRGVIKAGHLAKPFTIMVKREK
jgi:hypothetical protein